MLISSSPSGTTEEVTEQEVESWAHPTTGFEALMSSPGAREIFRYRLVHLGVEELLAPAILCYKEPARSKQKVLQSHYLGALDAHVGSLWHKIADLNGVVTL